MRKCIIFVSLLAILASCESKKQQQELENAQALAAATHEELIQAVNERDQLLSIINEITATTEDIKQAENMASINLNGTEGNSSSQLADNINAIKTTLQERTQRLNELEAALKNSKTSNSKLLATIDNLKKQIAYQSQEIDELNAKLNDANIRITSLGGQVDSLTSTVNTVTSARDSVQLVANEQEALANACYYAIGSKDELKQNGIIEGGGFLRSEKINAGTLNKSYFTQADKRTLTEIPLHSNKAKVITKFQPKDSYQIVDVNGQKVLKILNPTAFWNVSNYLVVQID